MQLKEALAQGTQILEQALIPSPRLTAEVLLLHATHSDRAHLFGHPERELTDCERVHFGRYLNERLQGKPTQYITGHQEFWGMDFLVNPDVLIPRPETEFVVETALEIARHSFGEAPLNIADVGTGSGCIAVAIARELPACTVYALDISSKALETARLNASRSGVENRIRFLRSDLLHLSAPDENSALHSNNSRAPCKGTTLVVPNQKRQAGASAPEVSAWSSAAKADLNAASVGMAEAMPLQQFTDSSLLLPPLHMVVSNPPYVSERDRAGLQREVREFEPATAVFAGESGEEVYSKLIPQAAQSLRRGGYLVLELGYDSQGSVRQLLAGQEWSEIRWRPDLAGITRVVSARRTGEQLHELP
ncbi:MAG: peptide chain release factor N(5)-glutamine methyltransferase [Acidobacteria bacterium]|nr:peptide chain release factor N(5)-glutamine methyltransferase [Acidobacteriota bacterium]